MKSIHSLAFVVLGGALTACGGGALTQAGAQVRLLKGDPPPTCKEVGGVSGYTIGPDYQERNKNKLRNAAAEKKGNVVRLEQNDSDGNAAGTAYRCPDDVGASAAAAAK
jgi:hypothetical protein